MQLGNLTAIKFEKMDRCTTPSDLERCYGRAGRRIHLVSVNARETTDKTVTGIIEVYMRPYGAANMRAARLLESVCGMYAGELVRITYVVVEYTITQAEALANGYAPCGHCGNVIDTDARYIVTASDGVSFCDGECAAHVGYVKCERCGEWHTVDDVIDVHGYAYCDDECAMRDGWYRCDECGEWSTRSDCFYIPSRGVYVCEDCIDNGDYVQCASCGDWLHIDDARLGYDDCERCEACDSEQYGHIYGYHEFDGYSPIGDGLHMGVELETDYGDNASIAEAIDAAFWHGEHDGSLDDGVELISQPMTIDYHVRELPAVARIAREHGALSYDAGTCGFHVHISREYYRNEIGMYGDVLAESRMRVFFAAHSDELVKFSRRTHGQCEDWCRTTVYGLDDDDALSKPHAGQLKELEKASNLKRANSGRYLAINGSGYSTIEVRLWRGSLNETTLLATIALTYAIARYVVNHADYECYAVSWRAFVAWALSIKDMPDTARAALREYLETRGL